MAPADTQREHERHQVESHFVWPGEVKEDDMVDRIERYHVELEDDARSERSQSGLPMKLDADG